MARVEEKIRSTRAERLLELRYGDPELREDPDYAAALEEETERKVPDPERRGSSTPSSVSGTGSAKTADSEKPQIRRWPARPAPSAASRQVLGNEL